MKIDILILVLFIAGCSTRSGIIPVGSDELYVSVRAPQVSFGPPVSQKIEVYKTANAHCESQGKKMEVIKMEEVNQVFGRHGSAGLTFKCVEVIAE